MLDEKAGRLAQQFGKFGEGLVLWWLGHCYNYSVALVDHEGADIIAHKDDEHLAISVKSIHAASTYYDKHNQDKLRDFSEKFGGKEPLTPAVAFVYAWGERLKDNQTIQIDAYLIKLDDFGKCNFSKNDKQDYLVNNGAKFGTLNKLIAQHKEIEIKHLRLQQVNGNWINGANE